MSSHDRDRERRSSAALEPASAGVSATFGPSKRISQPRLTDVAYASIRESIADGRYEPGARLVEARLAEHLGMSAMPVRLALDRLCGEGLVSRTPGRGARVAEAAPPRPLPTAEEMAPVIAGRPQPPPFTSLAEAAADHIRSAIVAGTHRAGDRLVERDLARVLGTSAVPVREALQRLHDEGLVDRTQRRGVRVATMTARDYAENAEVVAALSRHALDGIVAGDARAFATSVRALADGAAALVASPSRQQVHDHDGRLFSLIGTGAGNDLLATLLPRLRSRAIAIQPAGGPAAFAAARVAAWASGIAALTQALEARDARQAGAALQGVVDALLPTASAISGADSARRAARPRRGAPVAQRTLDVTWWGAQEAPGLHAWVDALAADFGADEGCAVVPRLLDTDEIAGYRTQRVSSLADVCFAWNGLFHLEAAWAGDLQPLEPLLPGTRLAATGATRQSVFGGQHYRVGFFAVGIGLAVNRHVLEDAGLDVDAALAPAPLLDTAARLYQAGVVPLALGGGDTYGSDWLFSLLLVQQLEREGDVHDLVLGRRSWGDTGLAAAWRTMRDLARGGYLPPHAAAASTRAAVELFLDGRAAMTLLNSGALPEVYARLGADAVAFVPLPAVDPGTTYAGRLMLDSQGLAIPSRARDPELAARLLARAHEPAWAERMWTLARQLPASHLLEPAAIDDPHRRRLYSTWRAGDHAPYVTNLLPRQVRQRLIPTTLADVLTGRLAPDDVPGAIDRACQRWRREAPAAVERYTEWSTAF